MNRLSSMFLSLVILLAASSCRTTSGQESSAKEVKLNDNAGHISVVTLHGDKVDKRTCAIVSPQPGDDNCGCISDEEHKVMPVRDFLRSIGDYGSYDPLAPDTSPNSAKALEDNYNASAEAAKTGNAQAKIEEQKLKGYSDAMHNAQGWLKALRKGCAEVRPFDAQYQWIANQPFKNERQEAAIGGKCVYLTSTDCSLCGDNLCTHSPQSSDIRGNKPYACWAPGSRGNSGVVCVNGTVSPDSNGSTAGKCVYLTSTDCSLCQGNLCTQTPSSSAIRGNKPYACWTPGGTGPSGVVCVQ